MEEDGRGGGESESVEDITFVITAILAQSL